MEFHSFPFEFPFQQPMTFLTSPKRWLNVGRLGEPAVPFPAGSVIAWAHVRAGRQAASPPRRDVCARRKAPDWHRVKAKSVLGMC